MYKVHIMNKYNQKSDTSVHPIHQKEIYHLNTSSLLKRGGFFGDQYNREKTKCGFYRKTTQFYRGRGAWVFESAGTVVATRKFT